MPLIGQYALRARRPKPGHNAADEPMGNVVVLTAVADKEFWYVLLMQERSVKGSSVAVRVIGAAATEA